MPATAAGTSVTHLYALQAGPVTHVPRPRCGIAVSRHRLGRGDCGHGPHRRAAADLGHGTGCEADCQLQAASPFTGEPVTKLGLVLAVKIDNIAQARSQTRLSKADIACVLPVEGGLTRLLAIFSSERPNAVCPVRSVREADLELLAQFGRPGFAYSGAKPKLLPVVAKARIAGLYSGKADGYFRNAGRPAPNNLYAHTSRLSEQARDASNGGDIGFRFGPAHWSQAPADGGTTFTTASGQPVSMAPRPVWVVLAARKPPRPARQRAARAHQPTVRRAGFHADGGGAHDLLHARPAPPAPRPAAAAAESPPCPHGPDRRHRHRQGRRLHDRRHRDSPARRHVGVHRVHRPRRPVRGAARDRRGGMRPDPDDRRDARRGDRRAGHGAGDLADLAAAAADSLARRFEAAGITLDRRLAASPILADPHWLHQVITNLLTNALKFTPAGGRVTVSTGPSGADAILQVSDTGPGIPAEDLPRIFDRFWRGQQATQVSGSGIGLAVAELAQAHRGRLSASSEPGRGTQMTLTLPRA